MTILVGFVIGLIFGLGLVISEMSNPAKVLNFLDLSGNWDPSLLFVMAGAVAVTAVGYFFVRQNPKPLLAEEFALPSQIFLDAPLLVGSALFGLGWGLIGYCPGPAITALHSQNFGTVLFVAAMLVGMFGARWLRSQSGPQTARS